MRTRSALMWKALHIHRERAARFATTAVSARS
jgi:hypothetical protein